jgi:hypothetical protein
MKGGGTELGFRSLQFRNEKAPRVLSSPSIALPEKASFEEVIEHSFNHPHFVLMN